MDAGLNGRATQQTGTITPPEAPRLRAGPVQHAIASTAPTQHDTTSEAPTAQDLFAESAENMGRETSSDRSDTDRSQPKEAPERTEDGDAAARMHDGASIALNHFRDLDAPNERLAREVLQLTEERFGDPAVREAQAGDAARREIRTRLDSTDTIQTHRAMHREGTRIVEATAEHHGHFTMLRMDQRNFFNDVQEALRSDQTDGQSASEFRQQALSTFESFQADIEETMRELDSLHRQRERSRLAISEFVLNNDEVFEFFGATSFANAAGQPLASDGFVGARDLVDELREALRPTDELRANMDALRKLMEEAPAVTGARRGPVADHPDKVQGGANDTTAQAETGNLNRPVMPGTSDEDHKPEAQP